MRIRSIKPEFWRSDDVNAMCLEDRLLFIGLWSYVDDNGVGIDRHADVCADLFAHDLSVSPHDTLMRVHDGLNRLHALGVIRRYKAGSKSFLEIVNWEKHQRINRPSPGRYPRSEDAGVQIQSPLTEDSLRTHEDSLPGAVEQGSRGAGEQGSKRSSSPAPRPTAPTSTYPAEFEEFWKHYPRRAEKRKALTAWEKARKRASNQELIDGARRYRDDPNREDQYTKHGATWLNADGWLDDPLPARGTQKPEGLTTRQRRFIEAELLKSNPDPRAVALAQQNGIGDGSGPDSGAAADRGGLRQSADRPADGFRVVEGGGAWALEA